MVATNSHQLLFIRCISTIINISLEVANTLCPHTESLPVLTMDTRTSSCCSSAGAHGPAGRCGGEQVPTICSVCLLQHHATSPGWSPAAELLPSLGKEPRESQQR